MLSQEQHSLAKHLNKKKVKEDGWTCLVVKIKDIKKKLKNDQSGQFESKHK